MQNVTVMAKKDDLLKIPKFLKRHAGKPKVWPKDVGVLSLREMQKTPTIKPTKAEKKTSKQKPNVQQYMNDQVAELIGGVEAELDRFTTGGFKSDFNMYKWLQKNGVKTIQTGRIASFYVQLLEELKAVESKEDDQLNEGYKSLKKSQLNRYIKFLQGVIEDCKTWSTNQKKTRLPRKKKKLSAEKLVKRLHYREEDKDFKIASVDPESIIGATQLWCFNVKYRKLTVYNALDRGGLSVKGSTIQRFDPETSETRKVRKPDEVLARVQSGGKIVLRKIMGEEVRTKPEAPTGRINRSVVLIKVMK